MSVNLNIFGLICINHEHLKLCCICQEHLHFTQFALNIQDKILLPTTNRGKVTNYEEQSTFWPTLYLLL